MNEFVFDNMQSPWDLALNRLRRGDTLSAVRFLALMEAADEQSAEDAAMELEQRGVMLDLTDLPRTPGNADTEARLQLEEKLFREGSWMESLEDKDPLKIFLEEMQGFEPIADGSDLAAKGAAGSQKAMQELTNGYLSTVFECAREYAGKGVLLLDLIQEGSLGLWQAILNYEGGPFHEHAAWWIRQAMARAVTLQARENGVGQHLAQQIDRYRQADKTLLTQLGRNPTAEEIALEMGVTVEEANSLGKMLREIRNMAKVKQEQNAAQEESPEDEQAVEDTAYYQTRERVTDLLSGLTEQESELLNLRYGLDGKAPLTAQEVAAKLNRTISEVVEMETAALAKMRREG